MSGYGVNQEFRQLTLALLNATFPKASYFESDQASSSPSDFKSMSLPAEGLVAKIEVEALRVQDSRAQITIEV